jgi:4-amino-4-deoxy-L-arabinose transferase-like glycosyltransferase
LGTAVEARRALGGALPRIRVAGQVRVETLALAGIMATALALRLAWIAYSDWQPTPDDDAYRYDYIARALLRGEGFVHLDGRATAFWPPGYPLLMAGVYAVLGDAARNALLLNAFLGTGTVLLVYLIGRQAFGRTAGLAGAAITACFPSLIFFAGVTLSETAFTFFMLLGVHLVLREAAAQRQRRNLALLLPAGLALGFAALIRGQALLLPLVLVPFWWRSGLGWPAVGDRLVAVMLGVALFVAPWTVRNAIEMHSPVLISTNAGVDFWIGHHDGASGRGQPADGLVFDRTEPDPIVREVAANREGFRQGLRFAVSSPLYETELVFHKVYWLYANDAEGLNWNEGHGGQSFLSSGGRDTLLTLSNGYYLVVMAFFVLGLPLWFSLRDPGRLLLFCLIGYWTLIHVVFFADPRFHAPMLPVIGLLAALPWVALWPSQLAWWRLRGQPLVP